MIWPGHPTIPAAAENFGPRKVQTIPIRNGMSCSSLFFRCRMNRFAMGLGDRLSCCDCCWESLNQFVELGSTNFDHLHPAASSITALAATSETKGSIWIQQIVLPASLRDKRLLLRADSRHGEARADRSKQRRDLPGLHDSAFSKEGRS